MLLFGLICLLPTESMAWGGKGHRIVAATAAQLLLPQKTPDLDALLRTELTSRSAMRRVIPMNVSVPKPGSSTTGTM